MARWSNLLPIGFSALRLIRQRPEDGKIAIVIAMIFLLILLCYYILIAVQMLHLEGDMNLLAECIESFTNFSQMLVKLVPLLIHRIRLQKLIESRKYFWNPDDFTDILEDVEKIYKTPYYVLNIYRYSVTASVVGFFIIPITSGGLPILTWVPNFQYAFGVVLAGQYLVGTFTSILMVGWDGTFVSLCAELCVQFKLLNHVILNLDARHKDFDDNLTTCIQRHSFLAKFAAEIIKIYKLSLLGQYALTVGAFCMQLFLLTENFDTTKIFLRVAFMSCLMGQMALFCFPGSAVSEYAETMVNSIYSIDWYTTSIKTQKKIAFMLLRAQKEPTFSAGGLADINRKAFTVILKTSGSFYTLMRQLKEN